MVLLECVAFLHADQLFLLGFLQDLGEYINRTDLRKSRLFLISTPRISNALFHRLCDEVTPRILGGRSCTGISALSIVAVVFDLVLWF